MAEAPPSPPLLPIVDDARDEGEEAESEDDDLGWVDGHLVFPAPIEPRPPSALLAQWLAAV
jgi:hypothetical protein